VQATETRRAAHLHVASFRPRGPQQPKLGLLAKAALTAFNDDPPNLVAASPLERPLTPVAASRQCRQCLFSVSLVGSVAAIYGWAAVTAVEERAS
jgi:hypothetical protein